MKKSITMDFDGLNSNKFNNLLQYKNSPIEHHGVDFLAVDSKQQLSFGLFCRRAFLALSQPRNMTVLGHFRTAANTGQIFRHCSVGLKIFIGSRLATTAFFLEETTKVETMKIVN